MRRFLPLIVLVLSSASPPVLSREPGPPVRVLGQLLLAGPSDPTPVTVAWLPETPEIDGRPDRSVLDLKPQSFPLFSDFGHPPTRRTRVEYRIAHTPTHLYLLVSTDAEEITYRARGFLVGDGLRVLLAHPGRYGRSREYFDLAASADGRRAGRSGLAILSYNFDQQHGRRLSDATRFELHDGDDWTHFELAVAWTDVPPLDPAFDDAIGLNVYFAKAKGEVDGELAANGYSLVADEGIWDEEIGWRAYRPMRFERPADLGRPHLRLAALHRTVGQALPLDVATGAHVPGAVVRFVSLGEESPPVRTGRVHPGSDGGPPTIEGAESLPPGRYRIESVAAGVLRSEELTVLPMLDRHGLERRVDGVENASTRMTLAFRLEQVMSTLDRLKHYESGNEVLAEIDALEADLVAAERGEDPYLERRDVHRRAFRSAQDGTLQPYSLKLPETLEPGRRYPLLVFLHGSGQDDRRVLLSDRSGGDFIELAPFGRDRYRAYSERSSQLDILEAIDDVIAHQPVDPDRIIIAGFSMGGYGALRTFWQSPDRYLGVAVLAGHPDLANEWLGPGHPDFSQPEFAQVFDGVPVFVYHGREDVALPVTRIRQLADGLTRAGARVELHIEEGRGHVDPGPATRAAYFAWLRSVAAVEE